MAKDIIITPASGIIDFLDNSTSKATITLDSNNTLQFSNGTVPATFSTSTAGCSALRVEGTNGVLFDITDDLSSSLMSVNTVAGLPVLEVFADYSICAGRYGQSDLVLSSGGCLTVSGITVGKGAGGISTNTALGECTLNSNTTGANNTAVGRGSMLTNTIGSFNVAVGSFSLRSTTSGCYNIAIGREAMYCNTTGHSNTAVGYRVMKNNTTGAHNSAFGCCTLYNNTGGIYNNAFGRNARDAIQPVVVIMHLVILVYMITQPVVITMLSAMQ